MPMIIRARRRLSTKSRPTRSRPRMRSRRPPATDTNTAAASQNGPSKGANPALSQISGEVAVQQNPSPPPERATASAVRKETNTGDSFRDPFAPSAQEIAVQPTFSPPPALRPSVSPPQPSVSAANPTGQSNISNGPSPESTNPVKQPIDKQVDQASRTIAGASRPGGSKRSCVQTFRVR